MQSQISAHPALQDPRWFSPAICALPDVGTMRALDVTKETAAELQDAGFRIEGPLGQGNRIIFNAGTRGLRAKVHFNGRRGNTVVVGALPNATLSLVFEGDGHLFTSFGSPAFQIVNVLFRREDCAVCLGAEVSSGGLSCIVEGPRRSIVVGDGSKASWGVALHGTDRHAIIDFANARPAQVNLSGSILLDRHVWLGHDVLVRQGVTIGRGSVLGARAVAAGDVPEFCVAEGVPAQVVREHATWSDDPQPGTEAIEARLDLVVGADWRRPEETVLTEEIFAEEVMAEQGGAPEDAPAWTEEGPYADAPAPPEAGPAPYQPPPFEHAPGLFPDDSTPRRKRSLLGRLGRG